MTRRESTVAGTSSITGPAKAETHGFLTSRSGRRKKWVCQHLPAFIILSALVWSAQQCALRLWSACWSTGRIRWGTKSRNLMCLARVKDPNGQFPNFKLASVILNLEIPHHCRSRPGIYCSFLNRNHGPSGVWFWNILELKCGHDVPFSISYNSSKPNIRVYHPCLWREFSHFSTILLVKILSISKHFPGNLWRRSWDKSCRAQAPSSAKEWRFHQDHRRQIQGWIN